MYTSSPIPIQKLTALQSNSPVQSHATNKLYTLQPEYNSLRKLLSRKNSLSSRSYDRSDLNLRSQLEIDTPSINFPEILIHDVVSTPELLTDDVYQNRADLPFDTTLFTVFVYMINGDKLPPLSYNWKIDPATQYLVVKVSPNVPRLEFITDIRITFSSSGTMLSPAKQYTINIPVSLPQMSNVVVDMETVGIVYVTKIGSRPIGKQPDGTSIFTSDPTDFTADFNYNDFVVGDFKIITMNKSYDMGSIVQTDAPHEIETSLSFILAFLSFITKITGTPELHDIQDLFKSMLHDPAKSDSITSLATDLKQLLDNTLLTLNPRFKALEQQVTGYTDSFMGGTVTVDLRMKIKSLESAILDISNIKGKSDKDQQKFNTNVLISLSKLSNDLENIKKDLTNQKVAGVSDLIYFGNNLSRVGTNILLGPDWAAVDLDGTFRSTVENWKVLSTRMIRKIDTNSYLIVADMALSKVLPHMIHIIISDIVSSQLFVDQGQLLVQLGYYKVYEVKTSMGLYMVYRTSTPLSIEGNYTITGVLLCGYPKFEETSVIVP